MQRKEDLMAFFKLTTKLKTHSLERDVEVGNGGYSVFTKNRLLNERPVCIVPAFTNDLMSERGLL